MSYADDMARLQRKRQLAQALIQQGAQPQGIQAGKFFVGPSPLSGLAGLAGIVAGGVMDRRAEKKEKSLNEERSKQLGELLSGMGGYATPGFGDMVRPSAGATAGINPLATSVTDPKRESMLQFLQSLPIEQQETIVGRQAMGRLFPKLDRVDLGNVVGLLDESGNVVRTVPKGIDPGTLRGQDITLRGQDLSSETTRRGQDLSSDMTRRGQNITLRGQDLSSETTRRGQDINAIFNQQKVDAEKMEKISDMQASLDEVEKMRQNVKGLLDSRGFSTIYGKSRYASPSMLPGGIGADAEARRKQLEAASFGISIQKMRGLGPLSDAEGRKVTQAYTRAIDHNQSEEAAREAWEEVLSYLELAELRAMQRAGQQIKPPGSGNPDLDAAMQLWLKDVN